VKNTTVTSTGREIKLRGWPARTQEASGRRWRKGAEQIARCRRAAAYERKSFSFWLERERGDDVWSQAGIEREGGGD
jgi:hypothetical protein